MQSSKSSWLFIVLGAGLAGYGAYDYFAARIGQIDAAKEWLAPAAEEAPVPASVPAPEPAKYFNPYRLGETVAKLRLPRLNTTLFVVEGTGQRELKKGPGHMPGTALPGVQGNCVIAGHRDTHFRVLEGIKTGDSVELETQYGRFRYQVTSSEIVAPSNVTSLYPTQAGILHLVTCYPFNYIGHAPKRLVISAALQSNEVASR